MGHGLDERHFEVLQPGSRASQVSPRRAHVPDDLCLPRKFRSASFARRSRPREGIDPWKDAGRPLAKIRERAFAIGLSIFAAGKEVAFHGIGVRAMERMGTRWEPGLAPVGAGIASSGPAMGFRLKPRLP